MKKENNENNVEITEKLKEVIIARIEAQVPTNYKLYIGSYGGLSKEKLIEHVKKGDEIGKFIVQSHISFMKSLASGKFIKAINSIENE